MKWNKLYYYTRKDLERYNKVKKRMNLELYLSTIDELYYPEDECEFCKYKKDISCFTCPHGLYGEQEEII